MSAKSEPDTAAARTTDAALRENADYVRGLTKLREIATHLPERWRESLFEAVGQMERGAVAFERRTCDVLRAPAPATDDAPTEAEAVERDAELLWRFWMREHRGDDLILWSEVAVKDEWRRVTRELRARLASPRATAPARNPMGEMPDGLTEADLIGGEF
jgi:hypothetical protein